MASSVRNPYAIDPEMAMMTANICRVCQSRRLKHVETLSKAQAELDLCRCEDCGYYSYFPDARIDYTTDTDDPVKVKRYLEVNAAVDWMVRGAARAERTIWREISKRDFASSSWMAGC